MGGRAVLNAPPEVIETALSERAMPGLFRSGESRATQRIGSLSDDIRASLAPERTTPVSLDNILHSRESFDLLDELRRRPASEEGVNAARSVIDQTRRNDALKPPTAGGAFDIAEGGFRDTAGTRTPAGRMERTIAHGAVDEVGRAVPSVAAQASRYGRLQRVRDAYKSTDAARGVAPGMAPTFSLRLAIAAMNRGIGPTMQGMYRAGQGTTVLPPNAVRALLLSELLSRSGDGSK
jgi:hypothetical protein